MTEAKKLALRERYRRLKAARQCVDCGAPLPDGWKLVRCEEHWRRGKEAALKWQLRNEEQVREKAAERMRQIRLADPEKENARMRTLRQRRKEAGICVDCATPALEDSQYCARHREQRRRQNREAWRKKHAPHLVGLAGSSYARRDSEAEESPVAPAPALVLGPDAPATMRVLAWASDRQWWEAPDLMAALQVQRHERDGMLRALRELQNERLVERDPSLRIARYRITPAGRAALVHASREAA